MIEESTFTSAELVDAQQRVRSLRREARRWEEDGRHNPEMVRHCLNEARELSRFYNLEGDDDHANATTS